MSSMTAGRHNAGIVYLGPNAGKQKRTLLLVTLSVLIYEIKVSVCNLSADNRTLCLPPMNVYTIFMPSKICFQHFRVDTKETSISTYKKNVTHCQTIEYVLTSMTSWSLSRIPTIQTDLHVTFRCWLFIFTLLYLFSNLG